MDPKANDSSKPNVRKKPMTEKKNITSPFIMAGLVGALAMIAYRHLSGGSARDVQEKNSYVLCTRNGMGIYTVDGNNSLVECIAVHRGYIVDSGDLDRIMADIPQTMNNTVTSRSVEIKYTPTGAIVVPGLSDSHCHILEYGASRQIPLSDGKNVQETVSFVREYITLNQTILQNMSHIIGGWGWDHASWADEQLPTWRDLEADPVVAGRPVVLQSRDGHALWVSKKALDDNGPYPDTIDGGVIFRDDEGNPTGVFMDSAQDLISQPPATEEELKRRFDTTIREALAVGLTSLHDAGLHPESLDFFKREAERDGLPIRMYVMTYFDEHAPYWGEERKPLIGAANDRLTVRSVKIFADGALRTGGSALHKPYADNPETSGAMRISPEVLESVIPRFLKDGWQVNVHAIGDRANGIVLDAFESSFVGVNVSVSALRPRLEHAQIMTDLDMARLGKLGVIASIQPTHAEHEPYLMWFAEDRLGPERVKGLYAFRSIIDSGARITIGSDFPVEVINPLKGFYAAVSRVSTEGTSPHGPTGWFPDQRLTRVEALRGMTIDAAYASFTENVLGSLTRGKKADYVVLSQNIMEVPEDQIMDTKVVATAIDGVLVYGSL